MLPKVRTGNFGVTKGVLQIEIDLMQKSMFFS